MEESGLESSCNLGAYLPVVQEDVEGGAEGKRLWGQRYRGRNRMGLGNPW